jgi:hypothetical protein
MDLSFTDVSSADAAYLAQELELALVKAGVPASALSLKRASPENMDPGTILGISVETVLHAIGAMGYIACFVKCIHEVVTKHHATIVLLTKNGPVKIPAAGISAELIERTLANSHKRNLISNAKGKAKTKGKAKVGA